MNHAWKKRKMLSAGVKERGQLGDLVLDVRKLLKLLLEYVTSCRPACWGFIPDCDRDIPLFAGSGIHVYEWVLQVLPESKAAGTSSQIFIST
jgi:hypothetical protein